MKHHIIVKLVPGIEDRTALISDIEALFAPCVDIDGVHGCEIFKNCIARENRYDLMIVIHMDREALPAWDASDIHREWKSLYSSLLASKAIFDCE